MNKSLLVIAAVLIFGTVTAFAISPYFTESSIDEALPSGALFQPMMEETMMEKDDTMMEETMMEKDDTMMEETMMEKDDTMMEETMMEKDDTMMEETMMEKDDTMMEETMMEKDDTMMEETMMEKDDTMMEETMMEKDDTMMEENMDEIMPVSYSGEFIGAGDGIHDAQGTAYTIPIDDGSNVLRLENFQSTNGPDLFVYLATDENALEFINLGALKANNGNQNYEIPDDTDLDKYGKVLIWCKSFSVLFGSADLSP